MASEARKNSVKAPRILIVDDDPGQRSLLDSFLSSQGFETVTATSGEQALERLRSGGFSMMISDVRMPGLTGLETLRRARQEHPVLPVLLVTAYADIRSETAPLGRLQHDDLRRPHARTHRPGNTAARPPGTSRPARPARDRLRGH